MRVKPMILDLISRPRKKGVLQPLLTEVFGICGNWESKQKIKMKHSYFYTFILKTGKISSWFTKSVFFLYYVTWFLSFKIWLLIFVFCPNSSLRLICKNILTKKIPLEEIFRLFTGIVLLLHMLVFYSFLILALYFFLTNWYCSLLLHVGIVLFHHMLVLYSSLTCWYCILVSHFNISLFSHMLVCTSPSHCTLL